MNIQRKVMGVIPARYGSTRLPGKILAPMAGKPMIQWVYERAKGAKLLQELFVAADDERIMACVQGFGGKAVMTGSHHKSGTDRIAEAVSQMDVDIVVNIQGDQPLLDPLMIDEAVQPMLDHPDIQMATLMTPIQAQDYHDPNVVKVVVDEQGYALYFSRSLIPYPRHDQGLQVFEHVGLYVYRKDFLLMVSQLPQGYLEKIELLEQLRVLEKGYKIYVTETHCASSSGVSVDTPEDLAKVEKLIMERQSKGMLS